MIYASLLKDLLATERCVGRRNILCALKCWNIRPSARATHTKCKINSRKISGKTDPFRSFFSHSQLSAIYAVRSLSSYSHVDDRMRPTNWSKHYLFIHSFITWALNVLASPFMPFNWFRNVIRTHDFSSSLLLDNISPLVNSRRTFVLFANTWPVRQSHVWTEFVCFILLCRVLVSNACYVRNVSNSCLLPQQEI